MKNDYFVRESTKPKNYGSSFLLGNWMDSGSKLFLNMWMDEKRF